MDNKQKEVIKSLGKEIIRLGLQDNVTRTTYNDHRDPEYSKKCDNINYSSYWVISSKIGWKQFVIRYV